MNSICERVQMCRQSETIAQHYFICWNKNQLEAGVNLTLLRYSCCREGKQRAEKCKVGAFGVFICIRRRRESNRSAEGHSKWREAEISFWLVCLEKQVKSTSCSWWRLDEKLQGCLSRVWIPYSLSPDHVGHFGPPQFVSGKGNGCIRVIVFHLSVRGDLQGDSRAQRKMERDRLREKVRRVS